MTEVREGNSARCNSPFLRSFVISGVTSKNTDVQSQMHVRPYPFPDGNDSGFLRFGVMDSQTVGSLDTDDSFVFEFGGGLDYFFTKRFSVSLDDRFLIGDVDTPWEVSGEGGCFALKKLINLRSVIFKYCSA